MPVYKNKNAKNNKWYYSFSYKESNKYKKKLKRGFKTKKEAENAMIEAMDSINKGTYIEPSKTLYRDFMDSWLKDKKINVKKSTYSNYQYLVENFILVSLGDIELQKINPREIQTLYNDLKENNRLSSENIRKIHTIINDALNKAFKWGMINRNPATLVDAPKVVKKEVEVWNQDEINIFLNVAKDSRYYHAFLLALTTGMRQGEILGLRWKDIDIENETISVVQTLSHKGQELSAGAKTDSGNRRISIDSNTLSQVLKHRTLQKEEMMVNSPLYNSHNDLVVRTSTGLPLSPRNLLRSFYSIIDKSGIKKIRFHDLRHTHASLLLKQGVNPKIVSERLGHANVRITLDTYSHLLPNLQKETVNNFSKMFYQN
ncbi:site-specific integrase [Virgibacillus sp. M23]|uniref:site-specific integrase n=1 Tax=Virgibacillus sp. M23 TaxID=3079030 RepID=UPI002A917306|nr:site-specific integrase [Virgibacillus sp. M23]MDY7046405.1 site-specific integrase [Virgibacillus sp. M23]